MNNFGYRADYYKPLSGHDIDMIHETSLKILEEIGYEINHKKALDMLKNVGCNVDYTTGIAKVPRKVLMDYVKLAPSRIRLCGRNKNRDCVVEPGRVFFDGGGGAVQTLDIRTGEARDSTLKDLAETAKITDALCNIHIMDTPCTAGDIPLGELDVNRLFAIANNSTKPLITSMYDDADKVLRLGQMIAGGEKEFRERPTFSMIVCTISPLKMDPSCVDNIIKYVKGGVPVYLDTCPIGGLTAPMTLAGILAQINAEALFNVFLPQVIVQGAKAFYTVVPTTCDMRTSSFVFGGIENGLLNAGCAQMAQYYNLPMYSTGGLTESKCSDFQAGVEKSMQVLLAAMAGGQIVHDANGMLNGALINSPAQLVVDNEVNGMVLRVLRGIEVTPETLAFDAVKKAGCGGQFVAQKHTRNFARTENFLPEFANRNTYEDWLKCGQKNMIDHGREKALDILKNYEPERLPDYLIKDIEGEFPEIRINDCMV